MVESEFNLRGTISQVRMRLSSHFQNLKSVLLAKAPIDEEIQHCLQSASAAFDRLRKRVFENNNITSDTKLMVYRAVVVPTLLYGSET
eukprot:g18492.t1